MHQNEPRIGCGKTSKHCETNAAIRNMIHAQREPVENVQHITRYVTSSRDTSYDACSRAHNPVSRSKHPSRPAGRPA